MRNDIIIYDKQRIFELLCFYLHILKFNINAYISDILLKKMKILPDASKRKFIPFYLKFLRSKKSFSFKAHF